MAAGKRTRFALVFSGTRAPAMGGDFLKELDVIKAEGCEHDGKQFVIFTTRKPRKSVDVSNAVKAFNETAEEKMILVAYENEPEIVVFDRGNCYRTHPISKIIRSAMNGEDVSWAWSVMADSEAKKKRAVNELDSDLVESSIRPSATKRVAIQREVLDCCVIGVCIMHCWLSDEWLTIRILQIGADADPLLIDSSNMKKMANGVKKRKSFPSKENVAPYGGMTKDVVVLLVKEIARSKDETIQTKNQLIELLMNRKCGACGGAE